MATIYDFTLTDGKGNQVPLANFKGKVMLIVNTATGCGFTPHYKHMINFGVKAMNGLSIDTNFNEMLSMLCEDMMQDYLALDDEDSPKQRFINFMINYFISGIREYSNLNSVVSTSYANAYAFGAWLCRQYGGAALVKEMMSNGKANNDCIVSAVNSLNGTSFSFDQLFGQFIKACLGDETYTFNQNAAQTLTYSGYRYPMTAINLWDTSPSSIYKSFEINGETKTLQEYLETKYESIISAVYEYYGPVYFYYTALPNALPKNYGMFMKHRGRLYDDTDSLSLSFTSNSGATKTGMKTYVYIK